jgi:hypothetical protein
MVLFGVEVSKFHKNVPKFCSIINSILCSMIPFNFKSIINSGNFLTILLVIKFLNYCRLKNCLFFSSFLEFILYPYLLYFLPFNVYFHFAAHTPCVLSCFFNLNLEHINPLSSFSFCSSSHY